MPETAPSPTPRIRSKRTKTGQQSKTILDLAQKGVNSEKIAKIVNVHPSTIRRFLDKIEPEYQALKDFRSGRADTLATMQGKNLIVQDKLLDLLREDGLLASLSPSQISGLVFALNTQHGTLYDKERLETGQSTANISTISKMLDGQVSTLYKRTSGLTPSFEPAPSQPVDSNVPEIMQE